MSRRGRNPPPQNPAQIEQPPPEASPAPVAPRGRANPSVQAQPQKPPNIQNQPEDQFEFEGYSYQPEDEPFEEEEDVGYYDEEEDITRENSPDNSPRNVPPQNPEQPRQVSPPERVPQTREPPPQHPPISTAVSFSTTSGSFERRNAFSFTGPIFSFIGFGYIAKCKGRYPTKPIPIELMSEAPDVDVNSENARFYLVPEGNSYILRERSKTQGSMFKMTIQRKLYKGLQKFAFDVEYGTGEKLINLMPTLNKSGKYELDLRAKFWLPSVKNCVLVRPGATIHVAEYVKTGTNQIALQLYEDVPKIIVFAIGVVLFVAKFSGND